LLRRNQATSGKHIKAKKQGRSNVSWNDLVYSRFKAVGLPESVNYVPGLNIPLARWSPSLSRAPPRERGGIAPKM